MVYQTRATISANWMQDLSQPQLVHSCFPALQAGCLCPLWVLLRWHQLFFLMGSCNYFGFGFRNGEWCNIQTPRRKWKIFDLVSTFFVTFKIMIKCDIRLTILLFFYFRYLLFYHKKVLEYEWLRRSRKKSQIKESDQIRLSPCSLINYPKNCTFWSILFSCQCSKWNKPPCRFGRRTHEGSTQITFLAKVVVQIYSFLLSCQKSLKTFGL